MQTLKEQIGWYPSTSLACKDVCNPVDIPLPSAGMSCTSAINIFFSLPYELGDPGRHKYFEM